MRRHAVRIFLGQVPQHRFERGAVPLSDCRGGFVREAWGREPLFRLAAPVLRNERVKYGKQLHRSAN